MEKFLSTETLIIELLLIVSLVAIAVRRLHVPYTVALVVVGLLLTTQSTIQFDLTPELILALFVPPLVFEAAFHLNFNELRRNLATILVLAVPGVILTTLMVGGLLILGTSLSLPVALAFGALISATDPLAVIALFRLLGVPKRLATLMEGESLFNDGTALVLFNLMLAVVLTGQFSLLGSLVDFIRVSIGGIALGLGLGWVISRLIALIDDYLIEITLTTVLAYGAYLLAEQFQFSGVLAVFAAGLFCGNMSSQGMSPTTRIVLFNFWEYVTFLVNSLVFLMIGLKVDFFALLNAWQPILWAIGAVLLARVVVVYGLNWLTGRLAEPISLRWQHILAWGGLRGALSLALALSLPEAFGPDRYLLRTMAFGVVLFTLLVQATTMNTFIHRLGITTLKPEQAEYELRHARLTGLRAAERHLERRYHDGLVSTPVWEKLKPRLQEQNALLADAVRELLRVEPALEMEELEVARREILRAQRSAYGGLRGDRVISEDVFEKLATEVDAALEAGGGPFWFVPKASLPQRIKESLTDLTEVDEITVESGAACAGQLVREVAWPKYFVIVSVLRGAEILIPKGDTDLQAGDILTVVGEPGSVGNARLLCQKDVPSFKKEGG